MGGSGGAATGMWKRAQRALGMRACIRARETRRRRAMRGRAGRFGASQRIEVGKSADVERTSSATLHRHHHRHGANTTPGLHHAPLTHVRVPAHSKRAAVPCYHPVRRRPGHSPVWRIQVDITEPN
ncbi:hypothetical protein K505DRAFT_29456 [Melanomma pulvis-pyrius CBS 109.77]|uniref:Uncharacterized protein n=1 Tax=Melanomma pulvis-pyrius CBS 109.77 TaxID=1314802 RepID=A0A6A6XWX7_9PLEO|nr:hypothetical protein K505DRAFT_29456 [Melanomma pulvis-pyrius CBS 109.77]